MQHQKVSATLLAFIEPLFLMPSGPPPEKFDQVMRIAVLVWNAVVLDDLRAANYLSQARAQLQLLDPRGREFMLALVDDLADRKRAEFAQDRWLVGAWQIQAQPGAEHRLHVEARKLPPP